jgi:hypothetical protein
VDPRAGLDTVAKIIKSLSCPCQELNSGRLDVVVMKKSSSGRSLIEIHFTE